MFLGIRAKILLTVLAIVLLFTFFSLYYFPNQQGKALINNYTNEVQNQARTIALGARIALNEQNYEGIKTAMDFVKENEALRFVALVQLDTVWNAAHTEFTVKDTVLVAFPANRIIDKGISSSDSLIVKRAPFKTSIMDGNIVLAYSTNTIRTRQKRIWVTALLVSGAIFLFGMLLGWWLSRSISHPVLALRKAAKRVGEGDLTPMVSNRSKDEIGELTTAFNNMVKDIRELSERTIAQEQEKQQMLASQNEELEKQVEERTVELKNSLEDLKATQAQLIQSEKMASLGELTAGIAHEIQNPLNFVNNFSEVNSELIADMKQEIEKGNLQEVKAIAGNIDENEQKINLHGKRADAIVKGMLQHSRSSTGTKEPTDINVLAEEYFRLAYHGMRAKNKSFNATMKSDYDPSIGKINIIPQDIGRVILNLINNAFYAVSEKKKITPQPPKGGVEYEPTVTVATKGIKPPSGGLSKGLLSEGVEIRVSDNGRGIPKNILDKIFQPFFTTKPTGQGTGLGLSLSYDIIKAHAGEIKVETKEGEGTIFTIQLPQSS